mmetsp:Transcript_27213/g.55532  ORF Transcript_27213/g.55532 Transcript_27213/m.55532 type:complete len:324 (-) Transcript_27213:696-1667(-)
MAIKCNFSPTLHLAATAKVHGVVDHALGPAHHHGHLLDALGLAQLPGALEDVRQVGAPEVQVRLGHGVDARLGEVRLGAQRGEVVLRVEDLLVLQMEALLLRRQRLDVHCSLGNHLGTTSTTRSSRSTGGGAVVQDLRGSALHGGLEGLRQKGFLGLVHRVRHGAVLAAPDEDHLARVADLGLLLVHQVVVHALHGRDADAPGDEQEHRVLVRVLHVQRGRPVRAFEVRLQGHGVGPRLALLHHGQQLLGPVAQRAHVHADVGAVRGRGDGERVEFNLVHAGHHDEHVLARLVGEVLGEAQLHHISRQHHGLRVDALHGHDVA